MRQAGDPKLGELTVRRGRLSRVPGRPGVVVAELTDGRWLGAGIAGGRLNLALAGTAHAAARALELGDVAWSVALAGPVDQLTDEMLARLTAGVVRWRLNRHEARLSGDPQ